MTSANERQHKPRLARISHGVCTLTGVTSVVTFMRCLGYVFQWQHALSKVFMYLKWNVHHKQVMLPFPSRTNPSGDLQKVIALGLFTRHVIFWIVTVRLLMDQPRSFEEEPCKCTPMRDRRWGVCWSIGRQCQPFTNNLQFFLVPHMHSLWTYRQTCNTEGALVRWLSHEAPTGSPLWGSYFAAHF